MNYSVAYYATIGLYSFGVHSPNYECLKDTGNCIVDNSGMNGCLATSDSLIVVWARLTFDISSWGIFGECSSGRLFMWNIELRNNGSGVFVCLRARASYLDLDFISLLPKLLLKHQRPTDLNLVIDKEYEFHECKTAIKSSAEIINHFDLCFLSHSTKCVPFYICQTNSWYIYKLHWAFSS